jgi:hypothetical protein
MSTINKAAEVLCRRDDSMYHHDRTDDFPCWACKATAQALADAGLLVDFAALADDEAPIERVAWARVEAMPSVEWDDYLPEGHAMLTRQTRTHLRALAAVLSQPREDQ